MTTTFKNFSSYTTYLAKLDAETRAEERANDIRRAANLKRSRSLRAGKMTPGSGPAVAR